ncbi:hypothetical protein BGZ51_004704 [Haplosporangium sp. Z 767]|nr:hypothetical protein BGZ51_004704 [Haplosporangium sp. Z 767]KAF9182907.1 hypothetical protein BGZ50_004639 [Haplosporangium sp. Z 11]
MHPSSAILDDHSTSLSSASSPTPTQGQNYGSIHNQHQNTGHISPSALRVGATFTDLGAGTGSTSVSVPYDQNDNDDDNNSIYSTSSYSTYSSSIDSSQELDSHFYSAKCDDCPVGEEPSSRQLFWTYVALAPVLLSILALFAGLLQVLPSTDHKPIIDLSPFAVGMVGWIMAFALRTPIYAFSSRVLQLDPYLCEWSTLLSAGALEEAVRLTLISCLSISTDFGAVYWLGLGWAGIETLYYIGQSLIYSRVLSDDDYRAVPTSQIAVIPSTVTERPDVNGHEDGIKATYASAGVEGDIVFTSEARHLLGIDRPWWSLMGRTSSMMVHIGLCCWLGYSGWRLLLPAAVVHGTLYVIWGVFMPEQWSVPATSYGTLMAAMAIFLVGLALYGKIV